MNSKEDMLALIHSVGLGHRAADLERLMKPSIRLRTRRVDEDALPLGASKFGGLPDLPPSFEWPIWAGEADSEDSEYPPGPMCFLAQLNLAEVAPYDVEGLLPSSGMLYFFCAIWVEGLDGGENYCRVLFYDGDSSNLTRAAVPPVSEALQNADYEPEGHQFPACVIEFSSEMTIEGEAAKVRKKLTPEEADRFFDQVLPVLYPDREQEKRRLVHRMLGYPQQVQGPMEDACLDVSGPEFAKREMTPQAWREWAEFKKRRDEARGKRHCLLLLQADSDPDNGLEWQEWGCGYFWIRDDNLRARDFSNVVVVMQCT